MYVVVGLGNPGPTYQKTRHNLGWMVLEQAAHRWGITFSERWQALQGRGVVNGHAVLLALPLIWMNQTGTVVLSFLQSIDLRPSNLIVVYDDLDLPLGALRIKARGGPGGHNGLRSVISCLETQDFCRLKVGIGRPPAHEDPAEYVLSAFAQHEAEAVTAVLSHAVDSLECVIDEGVSAAMNRFHTRLPRHEID